MAEAQRARLREKQCEARLENGPKSEPEGP